MGDREIMETYLNSAFKNTTETEIFPHETKSLLSSVIKTPSNYCTVTVRTGILQGYFKKVQH